MGAHHNQFDKAIEDKNKKCVCGNVPLNFKAVVFENNNISSNELSKPAIATSVYITRVCNYPFCQS